MVAALDEQTWMRINPERDRVPVRCGGVLDGIAAAQLRRDCAGLVDRGFDRLILDVSQTTDITPAAVSAIAAVNRRARARGCRFSLVPGTGRTADALSRAGLLGQLQLEGASQTFLDWSQ